MRTPEEPSLPNMRRFSEGLLNAQDYGLPICLTPFGIPRDLYNPKVLYKVAHVLEEKLLLTLL